ncbi:hypothetical protein JOE11_001259 [Robbsia andropogonis]|uniref:hypothetical protein n=1 Tax=Robbsia andropogonis TaxID=28092 RepID=UPI003D1B5C12
MFGFIKDEPAYEQSEKDWVVELSRSDQFWYDMIVNPPEGFDSKKFISDYLEALKETVKNQLDKRFIYFLATRKKVRFSTAKKPRYETFGSKLIFYVEMGREKKLRRLSTTVIDAESGSPIKPPVRVTDRIITIEYSRDHKISVPIHDFLLSRGIELGVDTEVHYVGYTANPEDRPINLVHRGFSDMLYRMSNDDNDFFVFYNLFKVISIGKNSASYLNFAMANSMIDQVGPDDEGKIIEKCLIKYFGAESQGVNKRNEEAELKNNLRDLVAKYKINTVMVHMEMEEPSEVYRFSSKQVPPADIHRFVVKLAGNAVELSRLGPQEGMAFE